jgi:GNAT superfamily N-acetyltransferase
LSLHIERAHSGHADEVMALFERADVPCFCQYYQFEGDHRDWQNRCANNREESQNALREELKGETLHAWVAMRGEAVVGWARLRSPTQMGKLYEGRLYRALPCFAGERASVMTLSCFLVDPAQRRQGIAQRLLEQVLNWARDHGISAVEALPRGASDVSDGEQWMGPLPIYEQAGFVRVHDFSPYPVYRLDLTA